MKIPDFSHMACKEIEYKNQIYAICPDTKDRGWYVRVHPSLWDAYRPWGNCKKISNFFADPHDLLREVIIEGRSLGTIIQELPEEDPTQYPRFEYNYDRFLADIHHHSEFIFYFREKYFFIDYWKNNINDPEWISSWIFIAERGGDVIITDNDFNEFVKKVDLWMIEHVGKSLMQMFNTCYKNDQTGELSLETIYYT
jgi:hypothetical protein